MKKMFIKIITIAIVTICFITISLNSQTRYVVLPFQNMEGKIDLNVWCYQYQDSVQKAVIALDPEQKFIHIVPADSVEDLLAELNLDPNNPQYQTDMWKAVNMLNAQKVISGNFYFRNEKLIINAYIYDVRTKIADPRHQAKNIVKNVEDGMSAVPIIVARLKPLLVP